MDGRARQSPRPARAGCGRPLSAKTERRTQPRRLGHRGTRHSARALPCCNSQQVNGTTKQSTGVRRLAPQQVSAVRALPPALRITVARDDKAKHGGAASCAVADVSRACSAVLQFETDVRNGKAEFGSAASCAATGDSRACSAVLQFETDVRNGKAEFGDAASCAATNVSRACPAARIPHNRMCGTTKQSTGVRGYNTPATRNIR